MRSSASALVWIALLLVLFAPRAMAWGPAGHRIVADLAERQLTPATRTEVRQLLGRSDARALSDVATWADDLRNDRTHKASARATAKLHYINFADAQCRYDAARDCVGGNCVVAAIDRYARILGDRTRPDAERAEALRFVVHFVGDAHQPLHAGYRRDRGGNRYQVQLKGRGSNLHAVWDSPVLGSRKLGWRAYANALARQPLRRAGGTPRHWAEESCRATRDDGVYPRGHRIDGRYLDQMRPLAERRVREAAARLASLLNRELGRR